MSGTKKADDLVRHGVELAGFYTQPYNAIVHPERVWKVTKYFLRRWVPYLTPQEVWLIIGARQLSYFNQKQPWFKTYDKTLADAAGMHVNSYRRSLAPQIASGEGTLGYFVQREGGQRYTRQNGITKQEKAKYSVRLDDPLTPGDAAALAHWLRRNSPLQVDTVTVTSLLENAIKCHPAELQAADPAPITAEAPLYSAAEVVCQVFPSVSTGEGWRKAADALHTHLVAPELAHLEPHYLRHKWLIPLGAGPALLLVYLRSFCFLNEESGELRNLVTVETGELEATFQISSKTLRRWITKLQEEVTDMDLFGGPFVRQLRAQKQPNQLVATTYRINLKTPLVEADLADYYAAVFQMDGAADILRITPDMAVGQNDDHTSGTNGHIADHTSEREGQNVKHAREGEGQAADHTKEGVGQNVEGWRPEGGALNNLNDLFTLIGKESTLHRQLSTLAQTEISRLFENGTADFAAVAFGTLDRLLVIADIIDGRGASAIQQAGWSLAEAAAWYLWGCDQSWMRNIGGYLIQRARENASPPAEYLALTQLPWGLWRLYALYAHLPTANRPPRTEMAALPHFETWQRMYGERPLDLLPGGVGKGIATFAAAFDAPVDPHADTVPIAAAREADIWQATLNELENQMTKATFDAWLRDARLLAYREGKFVIGVRNNYAKQWLEQRLRVVIERTLSAVAGWPATLQIDVVTQP